MASEDFLLAEIDRTGLIKGTNEALCRRRGVKLDELIGSGWLYLVNAEERDEFGSRLRTVFSGGGGGG